MFAASTASADSTDGGSALDDSDFEEGKSKFPRVGTPDESGSSESAFTVKSSGDTADESMVDERDGEEEAEALSSGDDYVDQSSDENEEEDSSNNDESESKEQSNFAFEIFQRETYQQFSKRSSTSAKIRNNQMTKNAEALKTADLEVCPRPEVQAARPREEEASESPGHQVQCQAECVCDSDFEGGWELKVSASGMHNHRIKADDHQGDVQAADQVSQVDLNGGKDAEAEKKSTERAEKDDEPNETKNALKTQKNQSDSKKKSGVVTWKFADRPLVNGMTKAQRKRAKAKAKENHLLARALAAKYREGKIGKMAIDQVVDLLDGSYSMFRTKYMVDALVLPTVEVRGKLSVRSYAVGQNIPVVKSIPQMNKIMESIETIKIIDDIDLLAYWSDYGYATFDQPDGMASII
ncbi:hypothetical protein PI125_g18254 [Phytophthora idaei]|nr:hypothetical protein PI125_g18254 [Phytophthora idaei]